MTVDLDPRELVDQVADERVHYEQEDRDRLTGLIGPGCDLLDDDEVERLLAVGRRCAVCLLDERLEWDA